MSDYPSFLVILDHGDNTTSPVADHVVKVYDATNEVALADVLTDEDGLVAAGTLVVASGTVIRFSVVLDDLSCGYIEVVTDSGDALNLILRPSAGTNIVLRPAGREAWYPADSANAVEIEVHYQVLNEDGSFAGVPIFAGFFPPGAEITLPYNPVSDKKLIIYKNEISADRTKRFSSLREAATAGLLIDRSSAAPGLDSIDLHVPTVTVAPTVTKAENAEDWVVFYPKPDAFGYSIVASEVEVRRASDDLVITTRPNGVSTSIQLAQAPFDCKVRYRWQNSSLEDAGDGRGWSDWSPDADAFGLGSATPNDPEGEIVSFDFDPHDVHNPGNKVTPYDPN